MQLALCEWVSLSSMLCTHIPPLCSILSSSPKRMPITSCSRLSKEHCVPLPACFPIVLMPSARAGHDSHQPGNDTNTSGCTNSRCRRGQAPLPIPEVLYSACDFPSTVGRVEVSSVVLVAARANAFTDCRSLSVRHCNEGIRASCLSGGTCPLDVTMDLHDSGAKGNRPSRRSSRTAH